MHVCMDRVASCNALLKRRRSRALHEMVAFVEETPSSALLMVRDEPGKLTKGNSVRSETNVPKFQNHPIST